MLDYTNLDNNIKRKPLNIWLYSLNGLTRCCDNQQIDSDSSSHALVCNFLFYMENSRQNFQFYPLCTALFFQSDFSPLCQKRE